MNESLENFQKMLPEHQASLHITHNQHKSYYEKADEYLRDRKCDAPDDVIKAMILANSIWEIQWYPDTPIGFNIVYGATLTQALEQIKKL